MQKNMLSFKPYDYLCKAKCRTLSPHENQDAVYSFVTLSLAHTTLFLLGCPLSLSLRKCLFLLQGLAPM